MKLSNTTIAVPGPLGTVNLASKWDVGNWKKLSVKQKQHVYHSHADFSYCFLNVILPYESECQELEPPLVLPRYQKQLCDNIQYDLPVVGHMACFCAVGFFKTTIAVLGQALWSIGNDPNLSTILATDCKDNAERYLIDIQKHIEGNEDYNAVFGNLYPGPRSKRGPGVKWTAGEMTVQRTQEKTQPSFKAYGYGSRVTGRRFDRAIADDVVTRENARTVGERESVHQFIVRDIRGRLTADKRQMMVVGSFYHFDDAHCRIDREGSLSKTWHVFKYPALMPGSEFPPPLPEGKSFYTDDIKDDLDYSNVYSVWPSWWTPLKLYEDWVHDKHIFAMNRMLQPFSQELAKFPKEKLIGYCRADGGTYEGFKKPLLTCWDSKVGIPLRGSSKYNQYLLAGIDIEKMKLVISIDPAVGAVGPTSGKRSYCVIQLWGIDENGRRILLDQWRREAAPPNIFRAAFESWIASYYIRGKTKIVFESNAMQKYMALDLRHELQVPITLNPMTGAKQDNIESLADLMDSGFLMYCWGDHASEKKLSIFEEELSQYPSPGSNDCIMAAVHAHDFLRPQGNSKPRVILLDEQEELEKAKKEQEHKYSVEVICRDNPNPVIEDDRVISGSNSGGWKSKFRSL